MPSSAPSRASRRSAICSRRCTGKVVKVNDPLGDSPEYINEDCYDEGWMVQVEVKDPKELDALMNAEQYQAYLKEQESH